MNDPADQSTACRFPTDFVPQNANGLNGTSGLLLNPSALTFQLIVRDSLGAAINAGQAGFEHPPQPGLMSVQKYEALLDLNYIAD